MRRFLTSTLIVVALAGCGPNEEPIYLRCNFKQGLIAPNPDNYVILVVDPQRNKIEYRHFPADLSITYRIIRSDLTSFTGTINPDEPSEGFIEVNRVTGTARIDYKPPTPSTYYDCKPTKPVM